MHRGLLVIIIIIIIIIIIMIMIITTIYYYYFSYLSIFKKSHTYLLSCFCLFKLIL